MARKKSSAAAIRSVVLILCAALLALGLCGKLSAYKDPNQSHLKSIVKLMQDDETRRVSVSAPVAHGSPLLDFADLAVVYSQPRLIGDRIQRAYDPTSDPSPAQAYALHFRPPPSTT